MFPIRNYLIQGNNLTPLLFNIFLEYAIRRVQVIQDGLKLEGAHHRLVYATDVKMLGGSLHTIKEKLEGLKVASKETDLEVNADNTKYMVMSRVQHAGRSHSLMTDSSSFEKVKHFKFWK
jgi:hypothetical protein